MQDKTITNALLALRARIIRQGLEGHVECLLVMRGVDPTAHRVPRLEPPAFRYSGLRRLILERLRHGPLPVAVLVAAAMEQIPTLTLIQARHRVHNALWKMKLAGLVRREGRLWTSIAPRCLTPSLA